MASVYPKRGKYWAQVKRAGKWTSVPTGETDRERAQQFADAAQDAIDKAEAAGISGPVTLRKWINTWLARRQEAEHDWKKDRGRLRKHILPVLGDVEIGKITTAQIRALVHDLRFKKKLANRTVRNIYSVLAAAMRDATKDDIIIKSPCKLDDNDLGPKQDKDLGWRMKALFERSEAEALISDPRIPFDRQMVYAFGLLAGLRPGEAAALRWQDWLEDREPLGQLVVTLSYSTSYSKTKATKTRAVRPVPVHPTLAAMLLEWRAHGWARMLGRDPQPNDLILPLPPEVKRTKRTGEMFRGTDYSGKRWRDIDLPMLGWRHRSVYDTKSTFITLILEDGASRDVIRDRVTHVKANRDAFDGYVRGPLWVETCREVNKLQIRRRTTGLLPSATSSGQTNGYVAPEEGIEPKIMAHLGTDTPSNPANARPLATSCDFGRALLVVSHTTTDEDDHD